MAFPGIRTDGATLSLPCGTPRISAPLHRALSAGRGPVTILVHGFKWSPFHQSHADPFRQIFADEPERGCRKVVSWTNGLRRGGAETLIPFAWDALPRTPQKPVPARAFREVYARAERAGRMLAALVETIRHLAPERPVHVFGHSLGARVGLAAVRAGARFERMVLVAGAETAALTDQALDTGRIGTLYSVTSRANAAYDWLFSMSIPCQGRTIHRLEARPGFLPIDLSRADTRRALAALGHRIALPETRVCHWGVYTAPGALPFYGALLQDDEALAPAHFESLMGWLPHALTA
ncbi:MAG: alpha/beta fold hydrolase [Rubricella sp.]